MDAVAAWLVIDFVLLIGFTIVGLFIERALNHRAEAALARLGGRADDPFSTWVRNTHKRHPRALAAILSSPTLLFLSIAAILIIGILPFPMPAEYAVHYLLLILFCNLISWLLHNGDRAVALRRKAIESIQSKDT